MFPRRRKSWVTAAWMAILLFTASSGLAARGPEQGNPIAGWDGLAARVAVWLRAAGFPGLAAACAAYSSSIDPNGQPASGNSSETGGQAASGESDYSAGIDPDGRP